MATERYYRCKACDTSTWVDPFFDALRDWAARGGPPSCRCGEPYELLLRFPFSFDANGAVRVVAVFAPPNPEPWTDRRGHSIRFHPFLVIAVTLNHDDPVQTAWLPYWHSDHDGTRTVMKFGQWAPHMDLSILADLVGQAQARGFLVASEPARAD